MITDDLEALEHIKGEHIRLLLDNIFEDKSGDLLYVYKIYLKDKYSPIGRLTFRLGESEEIQLLGHIGFFIHKKNRGHNYAKQATALVLAFLSGYGVDNLLMTADETNIASNKIARDLGGECVKQIQIPHKIQTTSTFQTVGKCVKNVYKLTLK